MNYEPFFPNYELKLEVVMSRIEDKFKELKAQGKKALITFVTAGDPNLDTTVEIVERMILEGADIIELGIPYSDPIAEGPVIEAANKRAMKNSIRVKDVMETVKKIRQRVNEPILYLLYYNCILQYGPDRFFKDCEEAGVDGLIVPDLPFEEREELQGTTDKYPVDLITMVAPTSGERIEKLAKNARGFLYCVSSLGVTGIRSGFNTNFAELFSDIDKYSDIPKAIGFGISTPEHIRELKGYCDGLIVGSAVVRKIEESSGEKETVEKVGEFVQNLRKALDS